MTDMEEMQAYYRVNLFHVICLNSVFTNLFPKSRMAYINISRYIAEYVQHESFPWFSSALNCLEICGMHRTIDGNLILFQHPCPPAVDNMG